MVSPVVRMTHDTQEPVLEWFPIFRYNKSAGEILAAFELIHVMCIKLFSFNFLFYFLILYVLVFLICLDNMFVCLVFF